jgi:hypothetical protein
VAGVSRPEAVGSRTRPRIRKALERIRCPRRARRKTPSPTSGSECAPTCCWRSGIRGRSSRTMDESCSGSRRVRTRMKRGSAGTSHRLDSSKTMRADSYSSMARRRCCSVLGSNTLALPLPVLDLLLLFRHHHRRPSSSPRTAAEAWCSAGVSTWRDTRRDSPAAGTRNSSVRNSGRTGHTRRWMVVVAHPCTRTVAARPEASTPAGTMRNSAVAALRSGPSIPRWARRS